MASIEENPQQHSDIEALEPWTARQLVDVLVTRNQVEPLPEGAEALIEEFSAKLLKVLEGNPEAQGFRSLSLDEALTPAEVARLLRFGWFFGEPRFKDMGVHTYDPHGHDSFLVSPIDVLLSHATSNPWFVAHLDEVIQALPEALDLGSDSGRLSIDVHEHLANAIVSYTRLPEGPIREHVLALRAQVVQYAGDKEFLLQNIDRTIGRISS